MPLRIGTRSSALARWQAEWVAGQLRQSGHQVELVLIQTEGDQQQGPIGTLGTWGLFTKEIQRALLDGRVDLAVHSLKDLPTETVDGLVLAAVPQRAPVADALIARAGMNWSSLPAGATVGTGSLRRRAQVLHHRADLQMRDIRGNVDTRLRKLHQGEFDAIILAEAGLRRLGFEGQITEILPAELLLPAVGQGALGLEARADDRRTHQALGQLDDPPSHKAVLAERALLAKLRGGCLAPIAAWGRCVADRLRLVARVLSVDGRTKLETSADTPWSDDLSPSQAEALGHRAAEALLAEGAAEIIQGSRLVP